MRHSLFGAALAVATLCALPLHAAPLTFMATGATAADIQATVDDFRNALGPLNANDPVNGDPQGRRQINWDAAPDAISDPNPFPGDFFNFNAAPRARGIEFGVDPSTAAFPGAATGFELSSTAASGQPVRFGFGNELQAFSEERLFAPTGGTLFDVFFFDPADQTTAAGSRGLGIVFVDNDQTPFSAGMRLFDGAGNAFRTLFAPQSPDGGLSFLGIIFDENVIARASVFAGFDPIDSATPTSFANESIFQEFAAMDDFIFGEPVAGAAIAPVPLPASMWMMISVLLGGFGLRRMRRT